MATKRSKGTACAVEIREQALSELKRTRLSFNGKASSGAPADSLIKAGSGGQSAASRKQCSMIGSESGAQSAKKQSTRSEGTRSVTPSSADRTHKTPVFDITAFSSESESDDDFGQCRKKQKTLLVGTFVREVGELKQKLAEQEHEIAITRSEALAAKAELRQHKLARLEVTVSKRVTDSEVETVRRDLTQSLAEAARLKEQLLESQDDYSDLKESSIQLTQSIGYLRNRLHEFKGVATVSKADNLALNKRLSALESKVVHLEEKYNAAKQETDSVRTAHLEEKTALRARLLKTRSRLNRVEGVKIRTIMENHRLEMELAREMVSTSRAKLAKLTKLHREVQTAISKVKTEF